VFASEPAADTNMGHILVALLRGGCQKLTTLQVNVHNLMCAALYCAVLYCTVQYCTVYCDVVFLAVWMCVVASLLWCGALLH
jgi:hypothetical protein